MNRRITKKTRKRNNFRTWKRYRQHCMHITFSFVKSNISSRLLKCTMKYFPVDAPKEDDKIC